MTPLTMPTEATQARETQDPRLTQLHTQLGKLDTACDRLDAAVRQLDKAFSRGAQQ